MPSRNSILIAVGVVGVLALLMAYHLVGRREGFDTGGLAAKGWVVYYMRGCHFCDKQKKALGAPYKYFIETENRKQVGGYTASPPYPIKDIEGFPFWYNATTGEKRDGFQDVEALRAMAT